MLAKLIPLAATVLVCGVAAGCGGGSVPAYFVGSSSNSVLLVQWSAPQNGQASGSITYDSLSGTAPNETLGVQTVSVSVTISGNSVTMKPAGLLALRIRAGLGLTGAAVIQSAPDLG